MNKRIFNYDLLSKYRAELMGIAMIWVIVFHIKLPKMPIVFEKLKEVGYGGVDIFLFLSGLGLYVSLFNNNDLFRFYKNRMLRLLPKYLIVVLIFSGVMLYRGEIDIRMALLNISSLSFWFKGVGDDKVFNWYIPALLFLYFITPLYFKIFNESKNKKNFTLISVFIAILLSITIKGHLLILTSRIPIFLIGIFFGFYIKNGEDLDKFKLKFYLILMIIGTISLFGFIKSFNEYLWSFGLWWYPFIIITPSLCLFLAYFLQYIDEKTHLVKRGLSFLGENSLEIYLCHVTFMSLYYNSFLKFFDFENHLILYNIICIIITVILAVILRETVSIILKQVLNKQ